MTDPLTDTQAVDEALPAPEEAAEDVDAGAWQGDRPDDPVDAPEPDAP